MSKEDLSGVQIYCPNCGTLNVGQLLDKIRYNIFRKIKKGQKGRHAQRTLVE